MYSLEEIKIIRKKLGLTQFELAKLAKVSQSLIAKIESKKIDPAYTKTKQIFDTLKRITKKENIKAKDIVNKNIIFIHPKDTIKTAIKKMKQSEISQLPVVDKNVIGLISEESILEILKEGRNINELNIKEVMKDCPPIIAETSDINMITNLLTHNPLILVSSSGEISGVITKSDILRNLNKDG